MVAGWAALESCLDQANHYGWKYSRRTISHKLPRNFSGKVQLFEKLHLKSLPFAPLKVDARALVKRLNSHLETRHFLVHGYLESSDIEGGWTLCKHFFEPDGSISRSHRRFTRDELSALNVDLTDLIKQATRYVNALVGQADKHGPHDPSG